ncbi:hypothetical protein ACNKHT_00990 [Shigella flexneri]
MGAMLDVDDALSRHDHQNRTVIIAGQRLADARILLALPVGA